MATPLDPAAEKELNELISNKAHPHHEGFWQNKKESVEYRDALMMRAWGNGEYDLHESMPVHLDQAMNAEASKLGLVAPTPEATATPPEAPAEPAKEWTQPDAETYLRMQFTQEGRDYDQVINEVGQGVAAIFAGEDGDLVTRFLSSAGSDPQFVLLARRVVDRLRAKGAI